MFKSKNANYDAVLLDVDNGPEGFTQAGNNSLYSIKSLKAIRESLNKNGVLAIWSAWFDEKFSAQLKKSGYKVSNETVRAHKGKGSRHTIYLAKKV